MLRSPSARALCLAASVAGCVTAPDAGAAGLLDAQVDADMPELPAEAGAATRLRLVTYNVAGLPAGLSASNPQRSSARISPLLNDYDLVLLQEDFAYHAEITSATRYPYASPPDTRGLSLGDGLSFLSQLPFGDFYREAWRDCFGHLDSGSDCLTPKGFAVARLHVGPERYVDVYDVHADAGSAPGDREARARNLRQLATAIATRSAGRAVIVAGDLNARYTRSGDTVHALLASAALSDAWLALVYPGEPPTPETPVPCGVPDPDDPLCDRIDKVLYRSGGGVSLRPISYAVQGARFSDEHGAQLSDHRPVAVTFEIGRD